VWLLRIGCWLSKRCKDIVCLFEWIIGKKKKKKEDERKRMKKKEER
jgi:endogenous inhibitor of DNA gyrase (YacG/DUF329 family)